MPDRSNNRTKLLVLLCLLPVLGIAVAGPVTWYRIRHWLTTERPLEGTNGVSNLQVKQDASGAWFVSFDYFYTGDPENVMLRVSTLQDSDPESIPLTVISQAPPTEIVRGQHHLMLPLRAPQGYRPVTRAVVVSLLDPAVRVVATQRVPLRIAWPDAAAQQFSRDLETRPVEDLIAQAARQIDTNQRTLVSNARLLLEAALRRDPKADVGYVELARAAMKLNFTEAGLHEAETLLGSALALRPDSVNAKVLLGYVRTHQRRFADAEALFRDAAATESPNLWLWANWGELLVMQERFDEAIPKYREAVSRPITQDTYDNARRDAFGNLLRLLEWKGDRPGQDALHRQRIAEFGGDSCYGAAYADFLLVGGGDLDAARRHAAESLQSACDDPPPRHVAALVHYVSWAAKKDASRIDELNLARTMLPPDGRALYLLARSEHTVGAARALVRSGQPVDARDREGFTALALAFASEDVAAARRLLKLGARPDVVVGDEQLPVALLPVLAGNVAGIRLLRESGVDYAKLQFQGRSILQLAEESGEDEVIRAMGGRDRAL